MLLNGQLKVRPNQIRQDLDDAHSLIIIARSMVLPCLIASHLSFSADYTCHIYISQKQLPRKMKLRLVIIVCAGYIFW